MTINATENYLPTLAHGGGPIYLRLANALEADIESGVLSSGKKLPPMRNLAFDIGVTVGTVSRAYNLLLKRGLINSEVGRGTYVLDKSAQAKPNLPGLAGAKLDANGLSRLERTPSPIGIDAINGGVLDLAVCSVPDIGQAGLIQEAINRVITEVPLTAIAYSRMAAHSKSPDLAPEASRQAGANWLARGKWRPARQTIVPTNGADVAVLTALMAFTEPGDKIAFEIPTYGPVAHSARLAGRRIVDVETDTDGLIAEAFEKLCAREHPKALFIMPSISNPTLAQLSAKRREAIAEIAQKYNVWILEDNVYTPMIDDDNPPFAAYIPQLTFTVSSLSKSVSAALRTGWVACPPGSYAARFMAVHAMIAGHISPINHMAAADLVNSGVAAEITQTARKKMAKRSAAIAAALADYDLTTMPSAPFAWLRLPEPWLSSQFCSALTERGIQISDESNFLPGRTQKQLHAVRIAHSAAIEETRFNAALQTIRETLDGGLTAIRQSQ